MARTKGAKNRATIIAEQMIASGMNVAEAKVKAKMQAAREKKASLKGDSSTGKKTRKPRAKKATKERHGFVEGFNTTTKSAWDKSQMTNSRKFAIRAMCLMCVGGSVKEVKECTCEKTCPLWKFRITG